MALEADIVAKVRSDFGAESEQALHLLRDFGKTGRLARCVVVESGGSIEGLGKAIDVAKFDYRDAIVAGEYSGGRQVRDLSVSFLLDTPETFWIGGVARMMAARDYALSSLTTRDTTVPPFQRSAAALEGSATFDGPEGRVVVEKTGRQWSLRADPNELAGYGMNCPFHHEATFRDAVSGYVLSRRRPRA